MIVNKKKMQATAVPPGGKSAVREIRIVAFPKEFQKDYWKSMDKRILFIFIVTLTIVYGSLFYFATRPAPPKNTNLDSRMLKKLGSALKVDPKLLEALDEKKEEEKDETVTASSGPASKVADKGGNVGKEAKLAKTKAAGAARAAAAAAKAGKGVLAVIGAVGGGRGFGGGVSGANLSGGSGAGYDDVLGGLGGIGDATGAAGERTTVGAGGAVGGGAGIEDLTAALASSGGVSSIVGNAGSGEGLVGVGKASVSGGGAGVSAADIQSVVDANAAAVNSCYTKELKKSPDLKGKLTVSISVNPAGKVSGVKVLEDSVGGGVASCVQNKIRGWAFPRGKKGMVTVNQTFVFTK